MKNYLIHGSIFFIDEHIVHCRSSSEALRSHPSLKMLSLLEQIYRHATVGVRNPSEWVAPPPRLRAILKWTQHSAFPFIRQEFSPIHEEWHPLLNSRSFQRGPSSYVFVRRSLRCPNPLKGMSTSHNSRLQ